MVFLFGSDLDRIQTYNLLSRNQVHYSVMLRGHFEDANIFLFNAMTKQSEIYLRLLNDELKLV